MLAKVQKFETGKKYGLEILRHCVKRVKTKIQEDLEGNSYICGSYSVKTSSGREGSFLVSPPPHPSILNRLEISLSYYSFIDSEKSMVSKKEREIYGMVLD